MDNSIFYNKYKKYKNKYLILKSKIDGELILESAKMPLSIKNAEIYENVMQKYGSKTDNYFDFLDHLNEIINNFNERSFVLYDFELKQFRKVDSKDVVKEHHFELSIIQDVSSYSFILDFFIENRFETQFAITLTNNQYFRPLQCYLDDEPIIGSNCEKTFVDTIQMLLMKSIIFKIYDFNIGLSAGRFGNIFFIIAHWISYLFSTDIKSSFIIGFSFVEKNEGRSISNTYFGPDVTNFPPDVSQNIVVNKYWEYIFNPITKTPLYKLTDVTNQYNEDMSFKNVLIEPTIIHKKKVLDFCTFYVSLNNNKLSQLVIDDKYVALHFRGADFCITSENKDYDTDMDNFYVLHFRYYLEALNKITSLNPFNSYEIVIFSAPEDKFIVSIMIEYLKFYFPHFGFQTEYEFVKKLNIDINGSLELVLLISKFNNVIISNSSFSFWCGFFCQGDNVLGSFNNKDIYPGPYKNTLAYADLVLNEYSGTQWIDINLKQYFKKYLFPCFYLFQLEKDKHEFSQFEIFTIIYCIFNEVIFEDNVTNSSNITNVNYKLSEKYNINISNIAILKHIINNLMSINIDSSEFYQPVHSPIFKEPSNSLNNYQFINLLQSLKRTKDHNILVKLINKLYITTYITH